LIQAVIITRRAFTAALSLTGLAALAGFLPLRLITDAMAQSAADVAKPVSLPDMVLGPASAAVTIIEFASMTCPHCAHFNETVFPKIKSEYIDTGKVRYIFREFPLDDIALAASAMARCVTGDDAPKYFALVDMLFRTQDDLVGAPLATINRIGKQAGFSEQAIKGCVDDDPSTRQKIVADLKYAHEVLKVTSTPSFFINDEMLKGAASFEEFDQKLKSLLKN
jgi:protein-disulfide isomerase